MSLLDSHLELDSQVALRPEPFGALAYHYGNRKLIFLKHPDVVRVVRDLDGVTPLAGVLRRCEIDEHRWPSFESAIDSLTRSEMLHEHHIAPG